MPSADYIVMILIALAGVLMMITNKPFFIGTEKYTEESLKKYPRPAGFMTMLLGAFGFAFLYTMRQFFDEKISGWVVIVCLVLVIFAVIGDVVVIKKTLVKKK